VCLEHIQGVAFLAVPESYKSIFITRDYLTAMVSPNDDSLFRLPLRITYPLGILFLSWKTNIENGDIPIYVGGQQEVLTSGRLGDLILLRISDATNINTPSQTPNTNFLIRLHHRDLLRLSWKRVQYKYFAAATCYEEDVTMKVVYHCFETGLTR
jgi:hypothetical protein